jgi:CTP:molybdopterin cytidylyltransferase MocA
MKSPSPDFMTNEKWDALILAAGRGPADPLAKIHGVSHKCLLPVAGRPMLWRVLAALQQSGRFEHITVSIEDPQLLQSLPVSGPARVESVAAESSAALSAATALQSRDMSRPVLITTGDHPLLTPEIVGYFLDRSTAARCDLAVALAPRDTILGVYPGARRTFLRFGHTRVSGCNLFALNTRASLRALAHWHEVERHRKQPWRLIFSFGAVPLLAYLSGVLSLESAFGRASEFLGLTARPILMPFADAAVDVDKPHDLELVEHALTVREGRSR